MDNELEITFGYNGVLASELITEAVFNLSVSRCVSKKVKDSTVLSEVEGLSTLFCGR